MGDPSTAAVLSSFDPATIPLDEWMEFIAIERAMVEASADIRQNELGLCAAPVINNPQAGFMYWASRYWMIVDKQGRERTLIPNQLQRAYLGSRKNRNFILKYRKGGASTAIDALYYWRSLFRTNQRAYILTHAPESTDELFERLKFGHDHLPDWMRPAIHRSNKKELSFANNGSRFRVTTAGARGLGRGGDTDMIHLSEIAHYRDISKVLAAIRESRRDGSWEDMETTPNGFNEAKDIYMNARDGTIDCRAHFFPWYSDPLNVLPVSFDGLGRLSKEEESLAESVGLSSEQIAWRRDRIADLGELFLQEHPEDDETCFLMSGGALFNRPLLRELLLLIQQEVAPLSLAKTYTKHSKGPFSDGTDSGRFTCWQHRKLDEHRYIIGADVAEGVPGGDYSVAGVLKVEGPHGVPEQVARWRGHCNPNDFGEKLAKIGTYFNHALIAVERNNHGHATLGTLKRECHYSNLYKHRDYDQRAGGTKKKLGFPTTASTRPQLLADIRRVIDKSEWVIRDDVFLRECMAFSEDGEAEHDDTVFAWGIAKQALKKAVLSYA